MYIEEAIKSFLLIHPVIKRLFHEEGLRNLRVKWIYADNTVSLDGAFQKNQKWMRYEFCNFPILGTEIEQFSELSNFLVWLKDKLILQQHKLPITILYQDSDTKKLLGS